MYQCVTANIPIWFLVCKLENHSVQAWHMQVYVCMSITCVQLEFCGLSCQLPQGIPVSILNELNKYTDCLPEELDAVCAVSIHI